MADTRLIKVKMLTSVATMPRPEYGIRNMTTFDIGKEYSLHPDLVKMWMNDETTHCEVVPVPVAK